jgi:transcriptional regulator with XRE-family HTH domain
MSPNEFVQCLEMIGWSQRRLASYLGLHKTSVARWKAGETYIPNEVAKWLRLRARHDADHPLPQGWTFGRKTDAHAE